MTAEIPIDSTQSQERREIPSPFSIAVLVSHESSGSNFKAIVKASEEGRIPARVSFVLSDGLSAPSFEFAEEHHVPHEGLRGAGKRDTPERDIFSRVLGERLSQTADIVVLAGFGLIVTKSCLDALRGKPTLNIHPGGIPDEIGKPVILPDGTELPEELWNRQMMTDAAVQRFLDMGVTYATSTVHIVTAEPDFGPVVERAFERIKPEDTVKTLYYGDNRLKSREHEALIRALANPRKIFEIAGKTLSL